MLTSIFTDADILIHCANAMGKMNNPEKKIDFYLKDCAVALITAALKIVAKNTSCKLHFIPMNLLTYPLAKPQLNTLSVNITGKCNCKACGQFLQFAHDSVQTTLNLYNVSADHFRNNNMVRCLPITLIWH